jgi:YVTN family beta-propeller protein
MNRRIALATELLILWIASLVLLGGCGGGTSQSSNNPPQRSSGSSPTPSGANPVPAISSLSPSCAPQKEQVLNPFVNGQLLVDGQNFVAGSVVRWNGSDRPTTVGNSGQLSAQISASDIASPGTAAVTVFNPTPGGGSSNTATFTITAGGMFPQSIAVDEMGKFAYVANEGCGDSTFGNVSMYGIDAISGFLTSIGPPVASGDEGGRFVSVDPHGKFAYVANWGEGDTAGSVSVYNINAMSGALTFSETTQAPCAAPPYPGSCSPWSVATHPSGKFAYVANEGGFAPTTISVYGINPTTGGLMLTDVMAAGGRAISVAVDPTGKFACVATQSDLPGSVGHVSLYTINPSNGVLTSTGTLAAGTDPSSVGVDPTGRFAYVTNSGSNNVSTYSIDAATGVLTATGTIAAGLTPSSVAIHPSGKFAYVTNSGSNDVSMYIVVNATTGALMAMGTIGAGSSPTSIAIHPSGKFAYLTNSDSNNVSMYNIDGVTGILKLIGTIGT